MNETAMSEIGMCKLLCRLEPARVEVANHHIYTSLQTVEAIRIFMEHHVFAVWDFMSLLKSLQRQLTCVDVPWLPKGSPLVRRLINEIVLGEESDEVDGTLAHFELYHAAMMAAGANTGPIDAFLRALRSGSSVETALTNCAIPAGSRAFVTKTFEFIESGKPHIIAAAFTFGREEPIPNMFRKLVGSLAQRQTDALRLFEVYLDRHIELDENHHGPMAAQMLAELCGDEVQRWNEAAEAAILALSARLTLWNTVLSEVARRNADAAPATPLSGDDLDQSSGEFGTKEFAGGQNGGPSRNLSFSA
jgi:hypothetical protein